MEQYLKDYEVKSTEWKFIGEWKGAFGWKCPYCGKITHSPDVTHKGCNNPKYPP